MIDFTALLKKTNAYKIISGDKRSDSLSHAYLIVTADGDNLLSYLKIFAKILSCKNGNPCNTCRSCTLIDNGTPVDVIVYPKKGENVLVEDIADLISESYVKPVESDKKIFILNHVETMNAPAQNKLLKTLEEPPKNVYIIMGATSEYPLLSTVKSRVKRVDIPEFSTQDLVSALINDYPNRELLEEAVASSDGTVGKTVKLYSDENLKDATELAIDLITNMKSSRDVLSYAVKISALKYELKDFISIVELLLRDLLVAKSGKEELVRNKRTFNQTVNADGFCLGAIVYALDKITEAKERLFYNGNEGIVTEWLLFQILEGKYKWRK